MPKAGRTKYGLMFAVVAVGCRASWEPAELVLVVARQRSSSTFLALSLVDALWKVPSMSVVGLDEPWESSRFRPANADFDKWDNSTLRERMANPLRYLQSLRSTLCAQFVSRRCIAVAKLFDAHFFAVDNYAWRPIAPMELVPLFTYPGMRIVVLERDVADEHCSRQWALHTRQWWVGGGHSGRPKNVRDEYDEFKNINCSTLPATPEGQDFAHAHYSWFNTVHSALHTAGARHRSINCTYVENTEHQDAVLIAFREKMLATP